MYGGKNYFYYKSFMGLTFLLIAPFLAFALGLYMILYSPYPLIFGTVYSVIALFVGFPRSLSGVAMRAYNKSKISKALFLTSISNKWLFTPASVKIFYAHLLILREDYEQAKSQLDKLNSDKLTYTNQSKLLANLAIIEWKYSNNIDKAMDMLKGKVKQGCDESIHYVITSMYLEKKMYRETRTHIENILGSFSTHVGLRQNMVIAYYHTTQYFEAKLHFRVLYQDLEGANKDTLYFMGKLKYFEKKAEDGNEFMKEALKFEKTSLDITNEYLIKKEIV